MKKIMVLICAILWLSGCMLTTPIQPVIQPAKSYTEGEIYTINTGSPMITVYNAAVFPEYKPKYVFQPPPLNIKKQSKVIEMSAITPDQRWIAFDKQENYYIIQSNSYTESYGIKIRPDGELSPKPWVRLSPPQFPDTHLWHPNQKIISSIDAYHTHTKELSTKTQWELPDSKLFEVTGGYVIKSYKNHFKAELIYTGKANNVITISYREYASSMARPAFYQDLRYDLSEGNEITFKSLKIKILETNNNTITFQVIDDGGLPWVPR